MRVTLADFHSGQSVSTNTDRQEGIKSLMTNFRGKCQPFMVLRIPISYLLQQAFCLPIFQISVLPHSKSSANLPLKNLCQSLMRYSLYLPLTPLMWQNKPWAIRIKALKRSLKPLKVSLNQEVTIWAVWQQALNGGIASPPQWVRLLFPNPTHPVQSYQTPSTAVVYSIVCKNVYLFPALLNRLFWMLVRDDLAWYPGSISTVAQNKVKQWLTIAYFL